MSISNHSITIVGSGIIGLSSALLLAEDGFKVKIIARDLPGDLGHNWSSPWAGAVIIPHSEMGNRDVARESFIWYWKMAHQDPTSGVRTVKGSEFYTNLKDDDSLWYKYILPGYKRLNESELPLGCTLGVSFTTCLVNPDVFLPWIKEMLLNYEVQFIRKEVQSLEEARAMTGSSIIINASGLGAKSLAKDSNVTAYRGQTMFIKSSYDEFKMIRGSEYTYVIPRMFSGGVIVGGISQENATSTEVDQELRKDILKRVNNLTDGAFANIDLERDEIKDIVGFRPGRIGGFRIEREGQVVHAYGFEGAGYIYSFGAAAKVKRLVKELVKSAKL